MNTIVRIRCTALFLTAVLLAGTTARGADAPIPRKDAFFGLHFDLHPQKTDTALGADLSEANITDLLTRTGPDYVQYDCKGHAGYAGYPTKVGTPSPGIVKDSLAAWRKVTREHGVGLYIHFSGVWDSVAIEQHPEWARIDATGKRDKNATSTFGTYVDELLIPQLEEVTARYELDGLWVDGECWATKLDYSPAALKAWREETGHAEAPKDRNAPHWLEWKMFHRRHFERYLSHWVDALHAFRPKLQITSNWMYTTFAPKPVVAKLDYLSGDYSPSLSVARARAEARYLASTNMPWDLMAWGFIRAQSGLGHNLKTAVHLQQEAAVVLMQGGGFQVYNQPTRSGYVTEPIIAAMAEVAKFCRARQDVSHKSTTVPQVAVLLSTESQWDRSDNVFSPWGGALHDLEGALHALLDLHYSVDVLAEHQLQPQLGKYPLVVIPDAHKLQKEFRQALLAYVNDGGSLLLLGQQCARLFEPVLGASLDGKPAQTRAELDAGDGICNVNGVWQDVTPTTAEPIGHRHPTRNLRTGGKVVATVAPHGKGRIGAVYGPLARAYRNSHHPHLRRLIGQIVERLFPEPLVTVDAPPCVDIALRRTRDGKLSLHLLNRANAPHADHYGIIDFVPTVGPIRVTMRVPTKPQHVRWVPGNDRPQWTWADGTLSVTVPSLHVHSVVLVE